MCWLEVVFNSSYVRRETSKPSNDQDELRDSVDANVKFCQYRLSAMVSKVPVLWWLKQRTLFVYNNEINKSKTKLFHRDANQLETKEKKSF